MKFKKVYLEITNICNLDCLFCPGNTRPKEFMNIQDFKFILNKLKGYTKYLYFHIMGEPLLHPEVNKLIDLASKNYQVNITTNGYFINRIEDNLNIRQINISLHDFNIQKNKSLNEYMNDIFLATDKLLKVGTIINYRLWVKSQYEQDIIKMLENRYQVKINGNTKIKDNLFITFDSEFIWPDLNNNYENSHGSCRALRDHLGILVDGTVVPCCLDYNGNLSLGNIYHDDLETIINSQPFQEMKKGFENNQKLAKLCQHCNFYDRIKDAKEGDKDEK
jgi:radical SAM protein with 4Fe4S-binding SPASM domain